MFKDIVNRVEKSKLISIDLEDYYMPGERHQIDLKDWLVDELYLKEKEFRTAVKNHNWNKYKNAFVAINCSSNAVIPPWAYMLISTQLSSYAKKTVIGNLIDLEAKIFEDEIEKIDLSIFKDKSIVIKGCSNKKLPISIYYNLSSRLLPIAKSIMYGEACSAVPVFKRKA
tara:strand:- start:1408 stop:1917 length:510 start_codon:yes stop_codon:yes gene_type:complete